MTVNSVYDGVTSGSNSFPTNKVCKKATDVLKHLRSFSVVEEHPHILVVGVQRAQHVEAHSAVLQ